MIDDVKEVGVARSATYDPRQQDMAIDQAVGIEAKSPRGWKVVADLTKLGCDINAGNIGGKLSEKLIRAQIHARPPLGAIIPHDGETQAHPGFRQITVNFKPFVVRLTSVQLPGTGGALPGQRFASSTSNRPPRLSFVNTAWMQWDR